MFREAPGASDLDGHGTWKGSRPHAIVGEVDVELHFLSQFGLGGPPDRLTSLFSDIPHIDASCCRC